MFQPLFCKLCDKNLSSSIVAKSHYKGKLHEKNVRKYLLDYAERTEEPLEKRAKIMESSKTESPVSVLLNRLDSVRFQDAVIIIIGKIFFFSILAAS